MLKKEKQKATKSPPSDTNERETRRARNIEQTKLSNDGTGAVLGMGNAASPVVGQVTIRTADIKQSLVFQCRR